MDGYHWEVNWISTLPLLVGGWAYPSEKTWVTWDDDIPNIWKNKIHVPNNQPDWFDWEIYIYISKNAFPLESSMTFDGAYTQCELGKFNM